MNIHREGFMTIFITLAALTLINIGVVYLINDPTRISHNFVLAASLIFFVFILQFFRNPARRSPHDEQLVIAPADGKVVVIEEVEETEFLNTTCRQISIFMSPFNVHVNRSPVAGTIEYFKYHPGKYLVAWHPKSSTDNERTTIAVRAKNNSLILFRQIAGAVARRIVWYVKPGQYIKQGSEFGFIKFGSRVDIFIPLSAQVKVEIGQRTIGGVTVLAQFSHESVG